MSKIKIKNFGPIKKGYQDDDGWMDVKKVTVFIGNQGSGKSTVAKLISSFSWIEKALTRGDYDIKWFIRKNKFRNTYCSYHRIENYFFDIHGNDIAELEYVGSSYAMKYVNGNLSIDKNHEAKYSLPQIMYVPAERNFISTVKSPKLLKLTSDSLVEFLAEFDNAKNEIKGVLNLPINNTIIEYDKLNDIINIKGNDYKVRLTEASSGFQSVVPLYLVSWYLTNLVKLHAESNNEPMSSDELDRFKKGVAGIWSNESLTDDQKRAALSVLSSKFNKTAFLNIVEEPEQNLFPSSQRQVLNSLLEFNNLNPMNCLIVTTHSPYMINYLTLAIKSEQLSNNINKPHTTEITNRLEDVVPLGSHLRADNCIIYELHNNGSISRLDTYQGLPSDENELNQKMAETNELFASLLEIEDQCQ